MGNTNKEKELWDSFSDEEKEFFMQMSYLYEHFAIADEELLKATWEVANFIHQTRVTDIHPYLFKGQGYDEPIRKDLIPPCKIGDKIYILKKEKCYKGGSPEEGNACCFCKLRNTIDCDYGYYVKEKIVSGFYVNKDGLFIEVSLQNYNNPFDIFPKYEKDKIKIWSSNIGKFAFFNRQEATKKAQEYNEEYQGGEK